MKIQKKVVAFFDLNFLELIAQTLSGVWKWYLWWLKIHMWALWDLADLDDFAEISADFDPYILVIFFEKSWFLTKFGLWDEEVGPTSKKIFFKKVLYLCILNVKYDFNRAIIGNATKSQSLVLKKRIFWNFILRHFSFSSQSFEKWKKMVRWVHHSFRFWMSTHWEHNNSMKVTS